MMNIKLKKYLNIFVALLIVVLIGIIVFLAINPPEKKDERTEHQKYYDNKCQTYATENTNYAKSQIVFIGDSITDLYVLDDHYADLDLACYNRGIGGDNTSGVLNRLKVSVYDLNPSKVVLMIGTNDINGNVENEEIISNYEKIISNILNTLPEVELYCVSIIPQNEDLQEYSNIDITKTTKTIIEINKKIRTLTEAYEVTYIDLFSHLADENNYLIKDYSDDGIHLNPKGLAIWTNIMKEYWQKP